MQNFKRSIGVAFFVQILILRFFFLQDVRIEQVFLKSTYPNSLQIKLRLFNSNTLD